MKTDGDDIIIRGDDSRFDPRAVWHGLSWSDFSGISSSDPNQQDESARQLPNLDYGIPLDPDNDGLENSIEFLLGTNPRDGDSDNNGISDSDEDFDNDGVSNGVEITRLIDPTRVDTDDDGINDGDELADETTPSDGNIPLRQMAIEFTGTDGQFVELPLQSRFALRSYAIEAWVQPDRGTDGGTVIQRIVGTVKRYHFS